MSASEHLASAVIQGQHQGSVGRWRRRGGGSGRDMQKRSPWGRRGIRRWQQHGVGSSVGGRREKFAAGMQAALIPHPYAEIEKGEEHLAAPNQRSDGGDNPPLCTGGIFNPWRGGGAPRSASPVAQLQRRDFFPGVEAQLWLFIAPTLTRFCCCRIVLSGLTSMSTINDDAFVECTRQEGGRDNATTTTATMTMLLWGGGRALQGLFARGGRLSCGAALQHLEG